MKPTQNNSNGANWREPDPGSTQKFITPEAEKSIREGTGRYRFIKSEEAGKKPTEMTAKAKTAAAHAQTKKAPSQKLTLKQAIMLELRERAGMIFSGISVNSEDIVKGLISAGHILVLALIQTTFSSNFPIFGAIPDLMLSFVAAVSICEGEKWGGVCGLCAAFVIQSLGNSGTGPELLALLYMPVGYIIGILSGNYFSNSLPVKAMYIIGSGIGRAVITIITATVMLDAPIMKVIADIAVPEFFATAVCAPAVYFAVWLTLRHFHKTRAERTEGGEIN